MGYKNAISVLPEHLLAAIQKHIDGEYIYIPRCHATKKQWGELKNSRGILEKRNRKICEQYESGSSAGMLAEQYFLSIKTVYKILSAMKKQ